MPAGAVVVCDFDSGLEENNSLATLGFASDLGFGDDEGKSFFGDSGGPEFISGAIAGVISFGIEAARGTDFNEEPMDGTWGEMSGSIRVSSLRDFILQSTDGEAVFVVCAGTPRRCCSRR